MFLSTLFSSFVPDSYTYFMASAVDFQPKNQIYSSTNLCNCQICNSGVFWQNVIHVCIDNSSMYKTQKYKT